MAKRESKTNDNQRGRIDTRLVNTGIYNTYEQHFVADDGTDIRVGRVPIQSQKPIRAGEVLAYIAAEVQTALHDGSGFKGEAQDAVKMLDKLKAAVAASDVESVAYWSYFLGCAMERHHTRQYEPMVWRERNRESLRKPAKAESDAKRKKASEKKAKRAREMYKEWYLDVPKGERPTKRVVEADIARQLNIEFATKTSARQVRRYLGSKNSGNL
jgi:hypothetical protein